jgi:adenosine deaminase CECR1
MFGWFLSQPPNRARDCPTEWLSADEMRAALGSELVDEFYTYHLSIIVDNPDQAYPNVNTVWAKFQRAFASLFSLLNYPDLIKDYMYRGLEEFYEDNVQYMEIRSVISRVCEDKYAEVCNVLSLVESAAVYKDAIDRYILCLCLP